MRTYPIAHGAHASYYERTTPGAANMDALFIGLNDFVAVVMLSVIPFFTVFAFRFVRIMNIYLAHVERGGSRIRNAPGEQSIREIVKHVGWVIFRYYLLTLFADQAALHALPRADELVRDQLPHSRQCPRVVQRLLL